MMLDVTAGNRGIWNNKNPPNVIFLDKETRLRLPPDVFADFRFCPFRDNVFDCILFDPPFVNDIAPWFLNPKSKSGSFYGTPGKTKRELLILLHQAQKEFQRLSKRLCLKWGDLRISIWLILPFFKNWNVKYIYEQKSPLHTSRLKNKKSNTKTYFVKFNLKTEEDP